MVIFFAIMNLLAKQIWLCSCRVILISVMMIILIVPLLTSPTTLSLSDLFVSNIVLWLIVVLMEVLVVLMFDGLVVIHPLSTSVLQVLVITVSMISKLARLVVYFQLTLEKLLVSSTTMHMLGMAIPSILASNSNIFEIMLMIGILLWAVKLLLSPMMVMSVLSASSVGCHTWIYVHLLMTNIPLCHM